MSFIITKKGLQDSNNKAGDNYSASDKLLYLKNPIWWAGMATSAYTLLYQLTNTYVACQWSLEK